MWFLLRIVRKLLKASFMYSIQTRSSLNFMYFFYDSKKHGLCIVVSVGFFIQNIAIIFSRFSIETKILTNLNLFFLVTWFELFPNKGYADPLPPPQKWPSLRKRCAMYGNERKIISQIFSFDVQKVQKM